MTVDLITVFFAGIATFLTPCVLPLVPIYLAALVGGDFRSLDSSKRGALIGRAMWFSLGFVLVFTVMGLGASSIGAVLAEHRGLMMLVGAGLVLVFALKFLGLISIPILDRVARIDESKVQTRVGWVNALVMGVVFAAGWSPCVGPVLGSVLTYTASQSSEPLVGAGYLAVYGLGFAVPLLVTAAFAETGVKLLGRLNPYLPRIERFIGALLLVVAGTLIWDATSAFKVEKTNVFDTEGEIVVGEDVAQTPRMVELFSEECPICKAMEPIVGGLKDRCDHNGVRVQAIDVSKAENEHLIDEYRVLGVPTFIFLDENQIEVARLVGQQPRETLLQALSALRGEKCPGLGMLPGEKGIDVDTEGAIPKLDFPVQQDKEVVTCRSTSSNAMNAKKDSKSSDVSETQTMLNVPSVNESPESCSQDLL